MIDISKATQTTIIITTHYIEEARKADKVGLIRNGKILSENSPEYLLQVYNESVILKQFFQRKIKFRCFSNIKSLENVFLKLCIKDNTVDVNPGTSVGMRNPLFVTQINREVIKINIYF